VRERPAGIRDCELAALLREQWAVAVTGLRYLPEGFGGYHWLATDDAGRRWFVTATGLGSMYGTDLVPAMETAAGLADAGLDFVVAPVRTAAGPAVAPLGAGYGVTLFRYVAGTPGRWGDALGPADRLAVVRMLAALHLTERPASVPVRDPRLAGRGQLAAALAGLAEPWTGGPFAEPARKLLAAHGTDLTGALGRFDDLVRTVAADGRPPVVTHGEPHPGNLLHDGSRLLLVDWDTVGAAPPERDLWWVLTAGGAEAAAYAELTGRAVSQDAVDLYRLRWPLDDLCLIVPELRAPHERDADTETSFAGLRASLRALRPDGSRFS
jgi:spectinomycin phosphotransferase